MILTLVEHEEGHVFDTSLQTLTLSRWLAEREGVPLHAVPIGGGPAASAGDALDPFGVSAVHVARHDALEATDAYAPGAWAQVVVELIQSLGPLAVVAPGTERGNEVLAHVGARLGVPMAANCVEAQTGETPAAPYAVTRHRWGGSLLEEAELDAPVKLLTVAPHAAAAEPATAAAGAVAGAGKTPEIRTFVPALSPEDLRVRVTDRVAASAERVSLGDARVVVGGGRGVGGAEGFAQLEELADLLGAAVGCSRVATSLGWRPHTDQIGQTGMRIAPDLYIACGISGAIQHMVGCKGAKRVLAINTDPEAPMVARADYAVVGDLRQVLDAVIAELRTAAGAAAAGDPPPT